MLSFHSCSRSSSSSVPKEVSEATDTLSRESIERDIERVRSGWRRGSGVEEGVIGPASVAAGRPGISSHWHAPARTPVASPVTSLSEPNSPDLLHLVGRRPRPVTRPRPHQMHHGRIRIPLATQARRPASPVCHLRVRQSGRLLGELLLSPRPARMLTGVPSSVMTKGLRLYTVAHSRNLMRVLQSHVRGHHRPPLP